MARTRTYWPARLGLVLLALISLSLPALAGSFGQEEKELTLQALTRIIRTRAYVPGVDFSAWETFVEKQKESIDKAQTEAEFGDAINAALEEFGFSHIVMLTPREATGMKTHSTVGIGILICVCEQGVMIERVLPNTPAEEAGLTAGDIIVLANGSKPTGVTSLLGQEGEIIELELMGPDGKKRNVAITRRKFSTKIPESLTWVDDKTVVLSVPSFFVSYDSENVEKLFQEASQAENMIIDLRGNGGGAILNLLHFLSMALPQNSAIGTIIDKDAVSSYTLETGDSADDLTKVARWSPTKMRIFRGNDNPYQGRIAVLIDERSASASEMAAQAFRDLLDAPVIGQRSAGAVLASLYAPLPCGFILQYPVNDYISIDGIHLEGAGIEPVLDVPQERIHVQPSKDKSVHTALALLKRAELREKRHQTLIAASE